MGFASLYPSYNLCKLICFARKHNLDSQAATKQHDGQISQNLSSPFCKNIPLNFESKSSA